MPDQNGGCRGRRDDERGLDGPGGEALNATPCVAAGVGGAEAGVVSGVLRETGERGAKNGDHVAGCDCSEITDARPRSGVGSAIGRAVIHACLHGAAIHGDTHTLQRRRDGDDRRRRILLDAFPAVDSRGPCRNPPFQCAAVGFAVWNPGIHRGNGDALPRCFRVGKRAFPRTGVKGEGRRDVCRTVRSRPGCVSRYRGRIHGRSSRLGAKIIAGSVLEARTGVAENKIVLRDKQEVLVRVGPIRVRAGRVGVVGRFIVSPAIEERVVVKLMAVRRRVHVDAVLQRRRNGGPEKVPDDVVIHLEVAVEIVEVDPFAQRVVEIPVMNPVVGYPGLVAGCALGVRVRAVDDTQILAEFSRAIDIVEQDRGAGAVRFDDIAAAIMNRVEREHLAVAIQHDSPCKNPRVVGVVDRVACDHVPAPVCADGRSRRIVDDTVLHGGSAPIENNPPALSCPAIPLAPAAKREEVAQITRVAIRQDIPGAVHLNGSADRLDSAHGDITEPVDVHAPVPSLHFDQMTGRVCRSGDAKG